MCVYYGQDPGKADTELIFLICTEQFKFCKPWGNFKKDLKSISNETPAGSSIQTEKFSCSFTVKQL